MFSEPWLYFGWSFYVVPSDFDSGFKGIYLPMNSYHLFFIIAGIPIRKKKKKEERNPQKMSANPVFKSIFVVAVSSPSLPVNHLL